ncbi:MAG: SLBB domain-containing protein [Gammaproteobacteria bacterium]|nr:SLBB domain-containing protein [Gammaproteobacteria bacterium]
MLSKNNLWIILLLFLFSPLVNAEDYRVQISDLIQVSLSGENSLEKPIIVNRQGNILLPEVGLIPVAGMTEPEMKIKVTDYLSKVFRDLTHLQVYVYKKQLLINVSGYVNQPGEFTLAANGSIQMALHAADGLRTGAQLDRIQLIRNGTTRVFNYKQYLDSGDHSSLPKLKSMDTLFIPASPMTGNVEVDFDPSKIADAGDAADNRNAVKIFGEVNRPGSFSHRKSMNIVDLLMRAGGVTRHAGVEQIRVITQGTPVLFDLTQYLDTGNEKLLPVMMPGATIFVPRQEDEIKTGGNRVYVMGAVARPGAFQGKEGATLMDVLANAGGPTRFAESQKIRIMKANGNIISFNLTGYMEGTTPSPLPEIIPGDAIFIPEKRNTNNTKSQWIYQASEKSIYIFGQVGSPGRYAFTDTMHFLDILSAADGPTGNADIHNIRISHRNGKHAQVSKLNLALYFETGDEYLLPPVKTGDTIYVPEKNRIWLDQSKESTIRVLGAVNKPGRYRFNNSMTLLDLLAEAGGPSANAYVQKITVVNLSCCRDQARSFDLAAFSRTASFEDLPVLRVGDTVYVPSRNESTLEKMRAGLNDIFQITALSALLGLL